MEALGWLFEQFGGFGAVLARLALVAGWAIGSTYIGMKVGENRGSRWQGWAAGLFVALIVGIMIAPSIDALGRVACNGADDFQACLDADGGDY